MKAFHNDPAIKAKYVNRMAAHIAADELIHGIGWEDGKGCAVGCTFDAYKHSLGPIELGLPVWLMNLEDEIFEALPVGAARDFVAKFLAVIPIGSDVEPVQHKLALRRINRSLAIQHTAIEHHDGDVQAAIKQTVTALEIVCRCHEAAADGNVCDWSSARLAGESAWSALESATVRSVLESDARGSAWLAVESAWMAVKSAVALSARLAAVSAAGSAVDSNAAWSAAWKQEADDLLELLAAA